MRICYKVLAAEAQKLVEKGHKGKENKLCYKYRGYRVWKARLWYTK